MTDTAQLFLSAAGNAVRQPISRVTFSLGRICRTLRNSLTRLSSNHQLPRSAPEVLRQSLSNLNSYFASLSRASSHGMERPVLAAAQLLLHWSFCQLQQRATTQAHAQLPKLLLTTSRNDELNEVVYALNQLMLATATPAEASAVLQYIHNTEASCKEWLLSLPEDDRQLFLEFEQRFKACLEKMAFWQPRSTLLLPLVNGLAPYISVYLDIILPGLAASPSISAPGQVLNASPVIIGETGPDAELWFKSIINLPGEVSLPPLLLRQGQSVCLRIPRCPAGMVLPPANQTADVEIAGAGIEANLATQVCVNNNNGLDLKINRQLNTVATEYPSVFYRHPLQIEGMKEPASEGICTDPPLTPLAAAIHRTVVLAKPRQIHEILHVPVSGWNILPFASAQDIRAKSDDAHDFDPFGPMVQFDEWPFYDYDDTTISPAISSTALPAAEQIDYEVNLFNRDKRILFAAYDFMQHLTKAPSSTTTTPAPAITQDSMTRLFGAAEKTQPQGSCRIRQTPLIARDLDDMLMKAQLWLRQMPASHLDDRLHVYFSDQRGTGHRQCTPLEEVVIICNKLMINNQHHCTFDDNEAFKFARILFDGSRFAENNELLNAWVQAAEGKHQLTDILIESIDRFIPDPGKLLSATFTQLMTAIKYERTSFSSLSNIVIDLKNSFKNNLLSSVINAEKTTHALLENDAIIEILQSFYLNYLKDHLPFFRLCDKEDISNEMILSTNGVLLTVAAGIIANDEKLNQLSAYKIKQFGMQSLIRFSDDYLLTRFSRYDKLLENTPYPLCDYLNHLAVEGRLLVHALYLNNKIYQEQQTGKVQAGQLNTDYQALTEVEKQLCILAFNQIPPTDQDFFLFASQEPPGLEIHFITSENAADTIKTRHFIGFIVTAHFERIRRSYFISEIPILNNFAAPLAYNDSEHFLNKEYYINWLNQQGKTAFVARLSAERSNQTSQTTFFISDKMDVVAANPRENWFLYTQRLSQNVIDLRFPKMTSGSTSSPGTFSTMVDFIGNLIYQFLPIQSCKQALNDVIDRPDTFKKIMLTLEDAALCLYDATPEGEESKLVKFIASVARSVVGKITDNLREEIQGPASRTSQNTLNPPQIREQIYLEDSQIKNYLANSTLFHADLGWMLHNSSLNIRQLPKQVKILDVRWNTITDQIYCKTNTTQGERYYRLDQQNLLLLPTNHAITRRELTVQELRLDVNRFLSHINNSTLDLLKTERLEQDMHVRDKYGNVYFKKEFSEFDFNIANITDVFFNNLNAPPGWKPVRIWVKQNDGDTIITEWKDDKNRIRFQQLSEYNDFFRSWHGDPVDGSGTPIRTRRDITTPTPFYTDLISPMTYGYISLSPYDDHQRKTAMQALIAEGNRLPDPPHFAEIACRKMMKELWKILPAEFIQGKFPAASEFIEKFAKWETAATINAGFKKLSRAVEIFHTMNPDEDVFYPKAEKAIREYEELDKKIKAYHYRNSAFKDNMVTYYKQFPEREMKVNHWLNKILNRILPDENNNDHKYQLKAKDKQELIERYPELFKKISKNIKELHSDSRAISNLFNNKLYPELMSEVLKEYTGEKFTDDEIKLFTSDFRKLQNNILAVTPDIFRVFEERYAKDGRLVAGCFKDPAEKFFFGPGDIAFTTTDDKHKYIYTQNIPNDDLFKQVAVHETDHINNGLSWVYTTPEIYIESYNAMKKFSFHGLERYGKELLSDRDHMVEYLMRDTQFLDRFCDQLMRFTSEAHHRIKIGEFQDTYLRKNANNFLNRYSDEAVVKRKELRSLMDIGYDNHRFLLYFLKQNADFMVSIWHRVSELAHEYLEPNQEIDKDALVKFDLLKSIVFKAGAALLDEVNAGASGSHTASTTSG